MTATNFARTLAELEQDGLSGEPAESVLAWLVERHRTVQHPKQTRGAAECGPFCDALDAIADALDAARHVAG